MEGPPLDGWWIIALTDENEVYEGWFKDQIGDTVIIELEPSKFRFGIAWQTVQRLDAYRTRPSH